MINFNLDLKNASALLDSKFSLAVLALCVCCFCVLVGMTLNAPDRAVFCAPEQSTIDEQETQLQLLDVQLAQCVAENETACIEREQRLCRKEKEEIKRRCDDILDKLGVSP